MKDMPTGTPETRSSIQRLDITYWTVVFALLPHEFRIGGSALLLQAGHAFLLTSKSLTGMATR